MDETPAEQLERLGTDAWLWASEFKKLISTPIAHNTLVTWFANAIEAGRKEGYSAGHEQGMEDMY